MMPDKEGKRRQLSRGRPWITARPGRHRAHRQKLHSTNTLERLNKEVKRRADVVGIFPNEASIVRLIGPVLMEQNDECQLQHRYLSLEPLADLAQLGQEERSALVPPAEAFIIPPRTA